MFCNYIRNNDHAVAIVAELNMVKCMEMKNETLLACQPYVDQLLMADYTNMTIKDQCKSVPTFNFLLFVSKLKFRHDIVDGMCMPVCLVLVRAGCVNWCSVAGTHISNIYASPGESHLVVNRILI